MTRILVLYYSMYGHIEIMAKAVAEGVRSADADVMIKRVPDTMPPGVAKQYGAKLEQEAPFATPDELPQYDAIIFGTPTRFGNSAVPEAEKFDRFLLVSEGISQLISNRDLGFSHDSTPAWVSTFSSGVSAVP